MSWSYFRLGRELGELGEFTSHDAAFYRATRDCPIGTAVCIVERDTEETRDYVVLGPGAAVRITVGDEVEHAESGVKQYPTQLRIYLPRVAPHDLAGMAERLRQLAHQMDSPDSFDDTESQDGTIGIRGQEQPIDGWLELVSADDPPKG